MDDLTAHVAHRRAQLAELREMAKTDHYGAAEACDRIAAELRTLGAAELEPAEPPPAANVDQVDPPASEAELEAIAVPASSVDADVPAALPPAVAAPRPARKPAKARKRAKARK